MFGEKDVCSLCRDHLVRSDLCSLNGLTDEHRSIDVLTSAVPHVWTSTDHRCVVWCRQLVLATTRALLEIIDEKNAQPQAVMKVTIAHSSSLLRWIAPHLDTQTALLSVGGFQPGIEYHLHW